MSKYNKYKTEFKESGLRLHLEEGRTKKSLTEEYHLGHGTITYWLQNRHKECEGNRLVAYRFIQNNHNEFGLNWLLRKFSTYPNAYYNFLKDRKATCRSQKANSERKMVDIYYKSNGVPGYRMMRDLLVPYGFIYCTATIYKYMLEIGLRSVVRRKKPNYHNGKANKIFLNLLNQNFDVEKPNQGWCTDFIHLTGI